MTFGKILPTNDHMLVGDQMVNTIGLWDTVKAMLLDGSDSSGTSGNACN